MTPAQKAKQTRTYNENRRNLRIEKLIDDEGPTELIGTHDYLKKTNWRPDLQGQLSGMMSKADLDLTTWAGCYTKWEGKRVQRLGGENDLDWDYKAFPENLLDAICQVYDDQ